VPHTQPSPTQQKDHATPCPETPRSKHSILTCPSFFNYCKFEKSAQFDVNKAIILNASIFLQVSRIIINGMGCYKNFEGNAIMKKCLIKNSILGFCCILNCLGTSVFDDERQKEQTLFEGMKPNTLKEEEVVPFVPADKLGLKFRNGSCSDGAVKKGTGRFNEKDITYAIYDVYTPVLQGNTQPIAKKLISLGSKEYRPDKLAQIDKEYKHVRGGFHSMLPACYFGCGLHAMKNLIFMTKILKAKTEAERTKAIADMDSYEVFLHYVEGENNEKDKNLWNQPWDDDLPGEKNWLTIWSSGKKWFDEPPATFEDTKRLRIAISKGEAFAPAGSKEILKNAIILGDVEKTANKKSVWKNGMQSLKRRMKENSSFIIPIHICYTWYDSDYEPKKPIRHWLAVVLRGFKNNNLEVFVVESGTTGMRLNKHKQLVGYILKGLGITRSFMVQRPLPTRNNTNPCLTLNRPQHSKKIMQPHALKRPGQNIPHGS